MRVLLLLPIVYLAAVAETSLVDAMRIGDVTPDLLALVAMVWLLSATGPRAFLAAGAVALVGDLVAPGRLGIGAAWMLLVGYGVVRLRGRLHLATDNGGPMWTKLLWQVPTVAVAVAVWAAGVGLSGRMLGDVSLPWSTLLNRAIGVGLYTAAVSLPVLMIVGWIREPRAIRRNEPIDY